MWGNEKIPSSVREAMELAEKDAFHKKALQSQINSSELLSQQKQVTANGLGKILAHIQTHAEEQARQAKAKAKLDSVRFWITTVLSFIAAVASLIALVSK